MSEALSNTEIASNSPDLSVNRLDNKEQNVVVINCNNDKDTELNSPKETNVAEIGSEQKHSNAEQQITSKSHDEKPENRIQKCNDCKEMQRDEMKAKPACTNSASKTKQTECAAANQEKESGSTTLEELPTSSKNLVEVKNTVDCRTDNEVKKADEGCAEIEIVDEMMEKRVNDKDNNSNKGKNIINVDELAAGEQITEIVEEVDVKITGMTLLKDHEGNENIENKTDTLDTRLEGTKKLVDSQIVTQIVLKGKEITESQTDSIASLKSTEKLTKKEFDDCSNVEKILKKQSALGTQTRVLEKTESEIAMVRVNESSQDSINLDTSGLSTCSHIGTLNGNKNEADEKSLLNGESIEMTEKTIQSTNEITEVIEIDDDDEETLSRKTNTTEACERVQEIDTDTATVVNKDDQNNQCKETSKISTIDEDVASTCAKMHTMPVIFYNKECINFECPKKHKEFHRAPQFAMNYFKVVKKKMKVQYICGECYDIALSFYQEFCGILNAKQPILLRDIASKKQEFVEILDSSDEEDNSANDSENKDKENSSFSNADLILIETELENSIRKIFDRVEIQNQLTWSKTIFTERVQKMQDELEYIDAELHEQQKMADKMYNDLYENGTYRISTIKPLDIIDDENTDQIPPYGEIERPSIKLGELYFAAKHKAIACWIPCRVVEQLDVSHVGSQKNIPNYKVKFVNAQYQAYKNLSAKLLAYYDPPAVRLSVGQRVIAYFDGSTLSPRVKDKCVVQSAFYPGIIAEEMKPNNFFRYLIFYDDGYTQYVSHKDVRLVCHVAKNVWEDVDQSSREFIQKYVTEYRVNRPMVQTHKGQKMATESNGRWVPARVIDIDCSLVRMQFEGPTKHHKEWIYRGSLRLNPVYMEYQKSKNSSANQMPISRLSRRTEPFIRYTEDEEKIRGSLGAQQRNANRSDTQTASNQAPKVRHLNANTIYLEDENRPKGKVIYYTAKRQFPTKTFRPHRCGINCPIVVPHNLNGYSPLAKPLLSGWERIFLRQKAKKRVFYRTPCGKAIRDMKELHKYLRLTKNTLNVDSFDFYPETSCLAEFEAENINLKKRDISNGQEKMPLPLVNYYDDTLPECTYSAKVIPTEGVNINTSPDFLICCDCEDDCIDKEKCACWQLTIEGVRSINPDVHIDDIGYQYKRLYEHLPTGIYECNSRCKCKSHCINRVVQHPLQMKLQVFKTSNRGWGLRCLNDIPRGSFVCIYAGNLLTEAKANEGGLDAGDEYFAELDYIETVEQLKEGYESDVETQEDEEDEEPYLPDDDDDFRPGKSFSNRSKRSQRQASGEGERQVINFNPNVAIEDDTKKKRPSVRQFFGKDEAVYVMDAKVTGNLGRYFNHSCSPNLFVQNVFVDTHDVRFPWVAFFSLTNIRAGTELTWNYNYEVGVVPGKVLYCQCGAPNCRQRLL